MFGFNYFQAQPTQYVLHHFRGRLRREGAGLSFFYFSPWSTLSLVPIQSIDLPFLLEENTADYQVVTVQGQLSLRIRDPKGMSTMLNLSVDENGKYLTEDLEVFKDRILSSAQLVIRSAFQELTLKNSLNQGKNFCAAILMNLQNSKVIELMGIEILDLSITAVRPKPEMARALEAEAREGFQQKADEAIYARRNAAVEQERIIKENELQTELSVAAKKRELSEAQMEASIVLEKEKAELIKQRVANEKEESDSRAYALQASLNPLKDVDWRILMAASQGQMDPKAMLAFAFRELAENAHKIGEINMSPDLLRSLVGDKK